MTLRRRYVLAVVGQETGTVIRLSYYRFRNRAKAQREADYLNGRHSDGLTRFVPYDEREQRLLD